MATFLTTGALKEDVVIITSSVTPLQLTQVSPTIFHITGIDDQLLKLPNATTLENGVHYVVINDSIGIVTVTDFAGTTLVQLLGGFSADIYLSSNATVAGVWAQVSAKGLFTDKSVKLIGGGAWSWDLATETLSYLASAYVVVAGLSNTSNELPQNSVTIPLGQVAYVLLNRNNTPSILVTQVAAPSAVPTAPNVLIIAYRDGSDVIIGSSFRLVDGQINTFDSGMSEQTKLLLGSGITPATHSPDWMLRGSDLRAIPENTSGIVDAVASIDTEFDKYFGQLRLKYSTATDQVEVTGVDLVTLHDEILSQELGSRILSFPQAAIDFTTGEITKAAAPVLIAQQGAAHYENLTASTSDLVAQVFTSTESKPLVDVVFKIATNLGVESGTLVVDIYAVDAFDKPTGLSLATSDIVAVDGTTDPESALAYLFKFNTPYTLTSGTKYAAVLTWNTVPLGGSVDVFGSDTSSYAGGQAWISTDGGTTWIVNVISDFDTAFHFKGDPLGLNFTPAVIPANEYLWYCLLIEYTGTNALGQSTARLQVRAASGSHSDPDLAPYPQFPTLFRSRPLGMVLVKETSGTITVVHKLRQLGVGGGSGGGSGGISVRAADFTTTSLPVGAGPLLVDGITINNEDMILYGNTSLNRVYKVTGIGVSLTFEEVGVFANGNVAPQDGDQVSVADGDVNDVVWEWDADTSSWTYISLSTENKQWLGLTAPDKSGGEWQYQVDPLGQSNNVVVEGETLEETIKRLDIRPDTLKRVRVIDLSSNTLPTGTSVIIDGVTLVDGDKVLFGDASLLGIYQLSGVGVAIAWTKLDEFGGSKTPSLHDAVLVREGTDTNCTIWLYDSTLTPPWHRASGHASTIWTGTDPYAAGPSAWDGTLSSSDSNVELALTTIDKYFRGLQLRQHPTDPNRIKILASTNTKTDLTVLNFTIADRLMSFEGAEIDFEAGNVYASDGVTVIDTFIPYTILQDEYFWYGIGLDASPLGSDATITPSITINYSTSVGVSPSVAPKPELTSRYTLGAVVVKGDTGGVGITPITQGSIVYLGQFTGITDLENTVAQNTLDIATIQAFMASMPLEQRFTVGPGGQSVFNLTAFSVDPSNSVFDVDYILDGRWQTPSIVGDFSDGAVRKNSSTQIETAEVIPERKQLIVLKRTMSGGSPLVDLTAITVDLGFVTPHTVGTLTSPAWSFILKDKVTADIWELEVRNGVFQVVKIN